MRIGRAMFAFRLYSLSVVLSLFVLTLYHWFLEFSCLNYDCAWRIWEPNLFIHQYEFVMMLFAIPGILSLIWRLID